MVFLFLSLSLCGGGGPPFDALAEWDAASACASQRQEGFCEDRVATIVGLWVEKEKREHGRCLMVKGNVCSAWSAK